MSRGMGGAQARYVGSCLSDTANPLHHNGFLMRADAENQKRQSNICFRREQRPHLRLTPSRALVRAGAGARAVARIAGSIRGRRVAPRRRR